MPRLQPIMIQGTGSETGKTTLVAGLCRLFADRGLRVAPFKSQNMALNSFVTDSGEEIARATAVQAAAARQRPVVHMNPLLLKPKADDVSQLIVHGRAVRDVTASEYFLSDRLQPLKWAAVRESIAHLKANYDVIVAEGAGSCAEPNLRRLDVVNMAAAHELDARVYVVADIDKGGAFASLLGSLRVMELTEPSDLGRVAGFLINKFRGDPAVLAPAVRFLADQTGVPVVGVLPYLHGLCLEEEDRVKERPCPNPEVDIAVLYLPHLSNASDFDGLAAEQGVRVRFPRGPEEIGRPDLLILPGTKNTTWDLGHLRRTRTADVVLALAAGGTPVVGVCGGYQMLGRRLSDPERVESEEGSVPGLGLLDVDVTFGRAKVVANRRYRPTAYNPYAGAGEVSGYEIHCGIARRWGGHPLYEWAGGEDGTVRPDRPVWGTFIHDLFNNPTFTRAVVDDLRGRKGIPPLRSPLPDRLARGEEAFGRLARALEELAVF